MFFCLFTVWAPQFQSSFGSVRKQSWQPSSPWLSSLSRTISRHPWTFPNIAPTSQDMAGQFRTSLKTSHGPSHIFKHLRPEIFPGHDDFRAAPSHPTTSPCRHLPDEHGSTLFSRNHPTSLVVVRLTTFRPTTQPFQWSSTYQHFAQPHNLFSGRPPDNLSRNLTTSSVVVHLTTFGPTTQLHLW